MLTRVIEHAKISKLRTYINKGDTFVIVSHEMPDGDAIGSSLGLYHYLMSFDKKSIKVIVPNDFPSFLKWLPGVKDIITYEKHPDFAAELIKDADVLFCLDFNAIKRVGNMGSAILASDARKVLVDHHLEPEDIFRLTISHPEISSTSELIFRIICALGEVDLISLNAAKCIYTGMMTDTGSFTYNSNDSEIYLIVSELIKKGIDKDEIYRKVNQVYSESRLRLMGYVFYEKLKIYTGKGASLLTLTQAELNRFRYKPGDTEGFVNMPLSIDGISFSVFFREEAKLIKISLRSSGDFPCNKFASAYFNGGGHKNASGGEFYGTLEDAVKVFEEGLEQFHPNNFENS